MFIGIAVLLIHFLPFSVNDKHAKFGLIARTEPCLFSRQAVFRTKMKRSTQIIPEGEIVHFNTTVFVL